MVKQTHRKEGSSFCAPWHPEVDIQVTPPCWGEEEGSEGRPSQASSSQTSLLPQCSCFLRRGRDVCGKGCYKLQCVEQCLMPSPTGSSSSGALLCPYNILNPCHTYASEDGANGW